MFDQTTIKAQPSVAFCLQDDYLFINTMSVFYRKRHLLVSELYRPLL